MVEKRENKNILSRIKELTVIGLWNYNIGGPINGDILITREGLGENVAYVPHCRAREAGVRHSRNACKTVKNSRYQWIYTLESPAE